MGEATFRGAKFVSPAGATTDLDYTVAGTSVFEAMHVWVGGAALGDKADLVVLDGDDQEVSKIADSIYIQPGDSMAIYDSRHPKELPPGFKIRIRYTSVGGANVDVLFDIT